MIIRTIPFVNIYEGILRRLGLDPTSQLHQDALRTVIVHINNRLRWVWRVWDWPELDVVEERAFRTTWTVDIQFVVGDELYYAVDGNYYLVTGLTNPPVGTLPTNTTYFTQEDIVDKYIEFDQVNQTPIGEVIYIYKNDPSLNTWVRLVHFSLSSKGIQLSNRSHTGNTVWVRYNILPSEFTALPYIDGKTYALGDLVLYPVTGECYKALKPTVSVLPSVGTDWTYQPFPILFSGYVKSGAFADSLRDIEQSMPDTHVSYAQSRQIRMALAQGADQEANDYVMQEIDRLAVMGKHEYHRGFGWPRLHRDHFGGYPDVVVTSPNPG